MPRTSLNPKVETVNFRVDAQLKAEFTSATAAIDKPAGQVLRDLMRGYVERRRFLERSAEARRQSSAIAAAASDPLSDEAEVMLWIEDVADRNGWTA